MQKAQTANLDKRLLKNRNPDETALDNAGYHDKSKKEEIKKLLRAAGGKTAEELKNAAEQKDRRCFF